ncbi:TIGR01841 family phasin [Pseudomonas putida]
MTFFSAEKFQEAQKANLDLLQQISGKVFASVEQFSQLQFKALRSTSEEQFESLRKLLAVRDAQGFAELQASLLKPNSQAERLVEYNRQVQELIAGTQADVAKLAELQVAAGINQVKEFVDVVSKNAPAASQPAVAAFKTTLDNAGSVYESAQTAAKQAAELAKTGFEAAANAATGKPGKAAGAI